jgi:hypothetical protein
MVYKVRHTTAADMERSFPACSRGARRLPWRLGVVLAYGRWINAKPTGDRCCLFLALTVDGEGERMIATSSRSAIISGWVAVLATSLQLRHRRAVALVVALPALCAPVILSEQAAKTSSSRANNSGALRHLGGGARRRRHVGPGPLGPRIAPHVTRGF